MQAIQISYLNASPLPIAAHVKTHLLFAFTSHSYQSIASFLNSLRDSPRQITQRSYSISKLNSFFAIAHHRIDPKTIALKDERHRPTHLRAKKELPSLHFLLDSEIS
jgi:hypothetical protein